LANCPLAICLLRRRPLSDSRRNLPSGFSPLLDRMLKMIRVTSFGPICVWINRKRDFGKKFHPPPIRCIQPLWINGTAISWKISIMIANFLKAHLQITCAAQLSRLNCKNYLHQVCKNEPSRYKSRAPLFFKHCSAKKKCLLFCLSAFPMNRVARLGEFLPDVIECLIWELFKKILNLAQNIGLFFVSIDYVFILKNGLSCILDEFFWSPRFWTNLGSKVNWNASVNILKYIHIYVFICIFVRVFSYAFTYCL
jgi:hypothetical protein